MRSNAVAVDGEVHFLWNTNTYQQIKLQKLFLCILSVWQLEGFYPEVSTFRLVDYKVRVIDGKSATAAKVRVIIESTDGKSNWTTVGVSSDVIEASWIALVDSFEYKMNKN